MRLSPRARIAPARLTGALTFQPFKNTTVRARFERVRREVNRSPRTAPYDHVSNWLHAERVPGSPYTAGRPGYDNRTALPANLTAATRIFTGASTQALLITNSPSSPAMGWTQAVQVVNPSAVTAFGVPDVDFDTRSNATNMAPRSSTSRGPTAAGRSCRSI